MPFDNPFRESRLNNSRNFHPEWDVPELNQGVTKWLVDEVRRLRGRKEPDPGQMIATMIGPPGYGKTHLFGRIEHLVGHEVFFVFVPAFEEQTPPLEHIRRYVVESLFRAPEGGHSPLELALARICGPAFADYFANLPPTLAARHETVRQRLGEHPEAVLEIVRQVKSLTPFLELADSLVQVLPQDAEVVRTMALGWAPAPWSNTAQRWLRGEDLPDAERKTLGLGEDGPSPLDVLRAIPALFGYDRPMMICCDQIEGLLMGNNPDAINRFSSSMMDLLQAIPAQLMLSCFQDQWEKFYKNAFAAFKMRVKQPSFKLDDIRPEQAIRLVRSRMASWSGREAQQPPTWPFDEASIAQLVRKHGPTPRSLIQECDKKFSEWAERGNTDTISLAIGPIGPPDLAILFHQEWNQEIEAIRQDPERSAVEVHEDRLYRGVLEALKLAQSAQRMRPFGGVRVLDIRDKAIKAAAPAQRPGALVTVAAEPGQDAPTILVALTKLEAANKLSSYFRAVYAASDEPVVGALLIHPRRDFDLGNGKTRADYDEAVKAGRLRLLPLEDYPMTYHATECLAALLERAANRELVLGGVTLSAEDCRDLVIKTGVIDNLDLFKMLGQARRTPSKSGPSAAAGATPPPTRPTPQPAANGAASTKGPEPKAEPATPPPDDSAKVAELESWAEKKLAAAVKKLNLLGQGVEQDGFEVGPTFARLRVRPVGKTNFKGVSNKAVDLRISLGLEVVPIVGSQAGCISVDIQRPDRAVVPLASALADPPAGLLGMPAFPVGQDVGGQGHWLNLADPSDCHLLVAGTTGSGKSEFLRATVAAMAARLAPDRVQFVLIDPKRVTFNLRSPSPYLHSPVAYNLEEALPLVEACMAEMDRRYQILESRKLSNVSELPPELLPRIVLVIDEFASFLEDKESKRVVNNLLKRIGAMARAAGIHLILSTQRPDKDVITPLLRENLPGRIALRVSSKAGSDLILGSPDAEHLLGRGDLFWKKGGELLRLQSPYVTQAILEQALRCEA